MVIETRKSGFRVANGEYVLFIDGDDWLDLKSIETLYKIAQKDNYDIVQYGYYTVYEDNTLIEVGIRKGEIEFFNNELLESLLKYELSNSIWSKFIKREFIIENNIFFPKNISYGEDLAFVISLSVHKPKVYITNKCLYYYYQRSTSLTNSVSLKILEIADVTIFVKEILINNELFQRYRKEFEYMAYIYNYYLRKDYIYLYESELSKKIFSNWKKLNISMNNNKYYKKLYEKDILKAKIIARICEKNYYLGKICYKIINS